MGRDQTRMKPDLPQAVSRPGHYRKGKWSCRPALADLVNITTGTLLGQGAKHKLFQHQVHVGLSEDHSL